MKRIMQWARDYLTIPVGMMLIAAAVAGGFQAREADASAYKMLAQQWPEVSVELKTEIAEAMQDDQVSRWESTKLTRDIMNERRALAWDMQTGTVEQERAKLQEQIGKDRK